MKKKKGFYASLGLLAVFAMWTLLVCTVDVCPIGPNDSEVGFATLNGSVHDRIGVHMSVYTITDWLGLVPIVIALGFGTLGLWQWMKRKSFLKVDRSIRMLGAFYIAVIAVYAFFEVVVVNYRPVLIEDVLEVSYPSSTTTLAMCVMPTAMMQFADRIKHKALRIGIGFVIVAFTAFMVIGRLVSGVHWLTDIVGGALLSAGLVTMYHWVAYEK